MKVRWLLDVDDVLNVDLPSWPDGQWMAAQVRANGARHTIRWAPALIDAIRDLHATGVVDIWWCTTWSPWADKLEEIWGFPPFPRCFDTLAPLRDRNRLKYAQALATVQAGVSLIWTDDEAIPTAGPQRAALTAEGEALLIAPAAHYGLTPRHMDLITAFANERSGR